MIGTLVRMAVVMVSASGLQACAVDECAEPLAGATRLLLVTTPAMDGPVATLRTFERVAPGDEWQPVSPPEPAVVGSAGLAWGWNFAALAMPGEPVKTEGDRRTPAGFYRMGATFGFDERSDRPGHIALERDRHVCVDDPASPHYNRIVSRAEAGANTSAEEMRDVAVYRHGAVIDYPTNREGKSGSCIFLHIWDGEGTGTAGCVALPEARVIAIQDWVLPEKTVIAVIPATAAGRLSHCLPPLPG